MRFKNSSLSLFVSLAIVLMFVLAINLATGTNLTAVDNGVSDSLQQEEGRFDPIQEDEDEDESDEGFEDEQDWDEEDEFDDMDDMDDEFDDMDDMDEFDDDDNFDQEDEFDDEDGFDDEEEFEGDDMEMERMEIESNIGRLETINRLAEIAEDDTKMASYAIMHLEEFVDGEEMATEVLKEMIESDSVSRPVKNLLKMKLAEMYSWQDRHDDALEIFKSMIQSR